MIQTVSEMGDLEAQMLTVKYKEGNKVGHWTLLKVVPKPDNCKTNLVYWLCQCDCKNQTTKVISQNTLASGKSSSCGCSRIKDLTDTYIGRLHVLYKDNEKSKQMGKTYWTCLCQCGTYKSISHAHLTSKETPTLSCGCLHREISSSANHKQNQYNLSGEYGIGYTSKGEAFYFDLEDYDKIKDYCWYYNRSGYVVSGQYRLNRVIMNCNDKNFVVDHIDRNPKDNRKINLRICFQKNNTCNSSKRSNNSSGVTGIWKHKHRKNPYWYAEIMINSEKISLGKSLSFNEMVKRRLYAEWKYFEEYSPHYNKDTNTFEIIYLNPDDNKTYKCSLTFSPIVPIADVEECTYEELKAIPSDREMGALGSSGK